MTDKELDKNAARRLAIIRVWSGWKVSDATPQPRQPLRSSLRPGSGGGPGSPTD